MKRALLAATALVSMSFTAVTPALADDGDDITLTPLQLTNDDGPALTPQELCEEVMRPAAPSGFQTEPVASSDSGWVDDGGPVKDEKVGDPVGTGNYTSSLLVLDSGFYRNGGSPNVWGHGHATLNYLTSTQEYTAHQHQIQTVTVSCRVWKYNGPNHDHLVQPFGLQTTGSTSTGNQDVPADNIFDTNNGPISVPGQEVYALICISPGKKGGVWTGKNGFNAGVNGAACAAASVAAGQSFIPSGNIPVLP